MGIKIIDGDKTYDVDDILNYLFKNKMKKYTKKEIESFLMESNAIEGVYDTDSFKQAKKAWKYLEKQDVLTINVILETHRILMLNQSIQPDEKGFFRRCEVRIGNRFGLNWIKVPEAMNEWIKDVETSIKIPGIDGENIKRDHIAYEKIHPFVDGNGRTGRLFLNWQRMKVGLPILIIYTEWPPREGDGVSKYYKWFKK